MTDEATVTINNIDYDTSNMSNADIEILKSMSNLNVGEIDEACDTFMKSLSTQQ